MIEEKILASKLKAFGLFLAMVTIAIGVFAVKCATNETCKNTIGTIYASIGLAIIVIIIFCHAFRTTV